MKNKIIYSVITVILMIASFSTGMYLSKNKMPNQNQFEMGRGLPNARDGGQMTGQAARTRMGSMLNGEVLTKDDKVITIKTRDNSTKNIYFTNNTKVFKQVEGELVDVTVGKSVMISGSANQDGSMSANDIQIRPENLAIASTTPAQETIPQKK